MLAAVSLDGIAHLWRAPSWAEIVAAEKRQGTRESPQKRTKIPGDCQESPPHYASWQAGPLGGRLVVPMPVELPEAVQLHEFAVAVEKRHVDGTR